MELLGAQVREYAQSSSEELEATRDMIEALQVGMEGVEAFNAMLFEWAG